MAKLEDLTPSTAVRGILSSELLPSRALVAARKSQSKARCNRISDKPQLQFGLGEHGVMDFRSAL